MSQGVDRHLVAIVLNLAEAFASGRVFFSFYRILMALYPFFHSGAGEWCQSKKQAAKARATYATFQEKCLGTHFL